jgi:hypothetical protein
MDELWRRHAAIEAGHPEYAELPDSKEAAWAAGVTLYFHGRPCRSGHVSPRQRSGGHCTECDREYVKTPKRREYDREYAKTPKAREYNREYYLRQKATRRSSTA